MFPNYNEMCVQQESLLQLQKFTTGTAYPFAKMLAIAKYVEPAPVAFAFVLCVVASVLGCLQWQGSTCCRYIAVCGVICTWLASLYLFIIGLANVIDACDHVRCAGRYIVGNWARLWFLPLCLFIGGLFGYQAAKETGEM